MLLRLPEYASAFRCLAGACPHTCCAGWEVVIDEETARRYQSVPGPLGEALRRELRRDADDDACFPLSGGSCPFLDGENLCEIHRTLGQEWTSDTCREHPRFTEDYGAFCEVTFSASCPAANALLLGSEEPLRFLETAAPGAEEAGDPWLNALVPLRERLLNLLEDRTVSLQERLNRFLCCAAQAQTLLEEERLEELAHLRPTEEKEILPGPLLFPAGLRFLSGLELLEPDWKALLIAAEDAPAAELSEALLERVTVYFAFRYLLKAVNDGDLLSKAQLCVFSVLCIRRVAAVCGLPEALRRFSCEIEHSKENLDALLTAFRQEGALSWRASLRQLHGEETFVRFAGREKRSL